MFKLIFSFEFPGQASLMTIQPESGSLPEVVNDGKTGLLVPPSDVGALSGSILRLLQDGALARQMGQAGQARVERLFRWETSARRTLEFYGEML